METREQLEKRYRKRLRYPQIVCILGAVLLTVINFVPPKMSIITGFAIIFCGFALVVEYGIATAHKLSDEELQERLRK